VTVCGWPFYHSCCYNI